ncbi:MAG: autotransporter domain-containing protein [Pseudolabrys sp.]|nr:autotransporter domain-containing protein [Pseudolabrys sp.]
MRAWRAALLASSMLTLAALPAAAQDATWLANPGSGDINTGSNWDTGTVPTGTAFFGSSTTTALTLNTPSATFGGLTFNAGASNYTITAAYPTWWEFVGAGIVVNGGSVAITNGHVLIFYNASTAGSATITNTGNLYFYSSSSAGSATITNHYSLGFGNSSTAGSATIINNYGLGFTETATAANATITNNAGRSTVFSNASTAGSAAITNNGSWFFRDSSSAGSASIANNGTLTIYHEATSGDAVITNNNNATTVFQGASNAGNARLINNGASAAFDFSTSIGPNFNNKLSAGSIAGNGTFNLGANELTVGGNNFSTVVSGLLSGTGGSLVKTGTGTMTLSGTNTYDGGTTVTGGLIAFANGGNLGSGNITLNGGGLRWASGNTTDISGRLNPIGANGATFDTNDNDVTFATTLTGSGGLTKEGGGALTLTGANTYTGATRIEGGTLTISGHIDSGTIYNGSYLNLRGNGTVGNAAIYNPGAFSATDNSSLGNATIVNHGVLSLDNNASAGNATISNDVYYLNFYGNSTAANATIINRAVMQMVSNASAGNAHVTNTGFGQIFVYNLTTLADSTFFNSGQITLSDNGNLGHHPTAGNAAITNYAFGTITFGSGSTAANATIANSGTVSFVSGGYGGGTAGNAQLINNTPAAVFDFSASTGPNSDSKVSAGSIAGNGRFNLGANELTVGANNLSTNVIGVIADGGASGGTGASLIKTGTGTMTLSGINTYSGATTVNGGALVVNGSIAASSSLTMTSGTTLGGTGTVGATTINAGGTLAPGNSIGTLSVHGSLTFNNGSSYAVEISPTAADRTNVTGTATLTGATVDAVALPGSFRGRTYTILNATGGLGGTQFAGLNVSGSSIAPGARNPHLTYDANNVLLVLDPSTIQLPAGTSGNQTGVAGAINTFVESGGAPPATFDALLNMTDAQLINALGQASGQPGASTAQAGIGGAGQFANAIIDGAFSDSGPDGAIGYAAERSVSREANDAYAAVTPRDRVATFDARWNVWASVYGGNSRVAGDATAGTSTTTSRIFGTAVGATYRATPNTQAGFALGGAGTHFDLDGGFGGGKADVFNAAVYARHNFGAAYVAGLLGYSWQDTTTDRTVTIAGTDQLRATFKAQALTARLESGWRYATPAVGITPYAALQSTAFYLPSYGETVVSGTGTFALNYASQTVTATRGEVGAKFDKAMLVQNGVFTLKAKAAWAKDWNTDRAATATFRALPGATFNVNGAQPSANAALLSLGAEMKWHNGWSLAGSFDGEFSQTTAAYAGKGSVKYAW